MDKNIETAIEKAEPDQQPRAVFVEITGHWSSDTITEYEAEDLIAGAVEVIGEHPAYRIVNPVPKWRIDGDKVIAVTAFTVCASE